MVRLFAPRPRGVPPGCYQTEVADEVLNSALSSKPPRARLMEEELSSLHRGAPPKPGRRQRGPELRSPPMQMSTHLPASRGHGAHEAEAWPRPGPSAPSLLPPLSRPHTWVCSAGWAARGPRDPTIGGGGEGARGPWGRGRDPLHLPDVGPHPHAAPSTVLQRWPPRCPDPHKAHSRAHPQLRGLGSTRTFPSLFTC